MLFLDLKCSTFQCLAYIKKIFTTTSNYTGEYRGAVTEYAICNSKSSVPKNIPIVFHNGSNYHYHFIIKELVEEFKKKFTCLRENTEKYITFTVSIEREVTEIDKNGEKILKDISFILRFIDSGIFMASSLSNLVNNLLNVH